MTFRWTKWWRVLGLLAAAAVLATLLLGWFLTTTRFWDWLGRELVAAVNDRINGEVTVQGISGNLVSGMVFSGVSLTRPETGEILRARELEISLSLRSLLKLQPVIGILKFTGLELKIAQDDQGRWNWRDLKKKRPPPPVTAVFLPAIQVRQGMVQVRRPGQEVRVRDVELDLDLAILDPGRPQQTIRVDAARLAGQPEGGPPVAVSTRLSWTAAEIQVAQAAVEVSGREVWEAQGAIQDLAGQPRLSLTGEIPLLPGEFLRRILGKWPAGLNLGGDWHLSGELPQLQLTGEVRLDQARVAVQGNLELAPPSPPRYQLSLSFRGLTEPVWRAAGWEKLPEKALSPLAGVLELAGSGIPPKDGPWQARLRLEPWRYRQAEVAEAVLDLKAENGARQELAARLRGNFGTLTLQGAGRLLPGGGPPPGLQGQVKLTSEQFNPGVFRAPGSPAAQITGTFTGNFALPAWKEWSQASLSGDLKAGGTWEGRAIQELAAAGDWRGGRLNLREARVSLEGLKATGQGSLTATEGNLQGTLELGPGSWPQPLATWSGRTRLTVSLSGPFSALRFDVKGEGEKLAGKKFALGAVSLAAKGAWTGGVPSLEADLTARGVQTPFAPLDRLTLRARTVEQRLQFEMNLAQTAAAVGQVAGSLERRDGAFVLGLTTLNLGRPPDRVHLAAPAQVKILGTGGWEVSPATLAYQEGQLHLAGEVHPERVSLKLNGEGLPVAALRHLWPGLPSLSGPARLRAELSGTMAAPELRGEFGLSPGQLADWRFQLLGSSLSYAQGRLKFDGRLQEKTEGPTLRWRGEMPVRLSLAPPAWSVTQDPLLVELDSENLDLGVLAALSPQVSAAQSPVSAKVRVHGTVAEPEVRGNLTWGPGSLTLKVAGAPYTLEPGELRLEGQRIILPRLTLHSGDGQATLGGSLGLAALPVVSGTLRLDLTNFLALDRAEARAVLGGHADLGLAPDQLSLTGRFSLHKGQFLVSFFRPEKHREIKMLPLVCFPRENGPGRAGGTLWNRLGLNLALDIPGGLWVRDRNLRVEGRGQLTVTKEPQRHYALGGRLQAVQGSYTIQGKVFQFEQASLTFPGVPDKAGVLDARAQFPLDEVTLVLVAQGPLDNLHPRVESIPPLPQRDVLSYLLFDRPASSLTRDQYLSAGEKAAGILGGLTAQKVKDVLGEGVPLLGEITPTGGKDTVGVGRKLTKDITVSYERKLNPLRSEDVNQIRVDYKINKYLNVESQVGKRNSGGDVFFNLDF